MDAEEFITTLESAGYAPRPYSGRFMYGAQCVAVDTDESGEPLSYTDLLAMGANLALGCGDGVLDVFANTRLDSMGLGIVVYWPWLEWPDGRTYQAEDGPTYSSADGWQ